MAMMGWFHFLEGHRNIYLRHCLMQTILQAEFDDMVEASEVARAVKHPFRNLLKRRNRPQLTMGTCIPAFQQLSGNNSFLFYAPVIFQSLGMGNDASLYSAIMKGVVISFGALVSMFTVDRVRRRFLFMEGGTQMIICHFIISILLALKFGKGENIPTGYGVGVMLLIFVFTAAYGWSWGPLSWLICSEIFPMKNCSTEQSIVVCINLFFTAIISQSFLVLLCYLKYGSLFLFGALASMYNRGEKLPLLCVVKCLTQHWSSPPVWSCHSS